VGAQPGAVVRLFSVRVIREGEIVIAAESKEQARQRALSCAAQAEDQGDDSLDVDWNVESVREIKSAEELPGEWCTDSIVYGPDEDVYVSDVLNESK
jgi:hypothetical protein